MNQILELLDPIRANEGVFCVANTNYISDIDDLLRRTGRFEHNIKVVTPDKAS